nr:reverse transcriptase domain-containing protein [Tanacetum cinerariifolium]
MQQEKSKEVKAHLSFEGSFKKNSKIQEESQHSESRTLDARDLRRRLRCYREGTSSRDTKAFSKSEDSRGGQWKSRSKNEKSSIEEDELSQPWVCEETDPFIPLVKVKRWAMPTWCHMFNSTLTGFAREWFDDLPLESIDSYDDLKKASLANYQQQKKCIKDLSVDEMMRVTTAFLKGEVAASNQARKKALLRSEWRRDKFTLLTKSPKEILGLDKGKFKAPPPMTTPVEKRNSNKSCEFHGEVWHNTDECIHLKRQIKKLVKIEKLSHVIKDVKQGSKNDQPKTTKKGETSRNDKPLAVLMDQPWLRPKVKNQMVPVIAPLIGFSGEIIWHMGQILLSVKIGDVEHFTSTWMNFVVVRSSFSYNMIIGRPGVRKIQVSPSTAHRILKFPVPGGILTLRSSRIIPLECTMVSEPEAQPSDIIQAAEEESKHSLDVFAWKPADMIGVSRHIVEHILNRHGGDIQNPEGNKHEAKPKQMHLQNREGHVPGIQSEYRRNNALPFFKTLKKCKKKNDFQWIAEVKAAFKEMKILIAELPTLTAPMEREQLIVYLTAAQEAYRPRTLVKGQILADFIVERPKDDPLDMPMEAEEELPNSWTLFTDGSSCVDGSGAGLVLTNPKGAEFTYALRFRFDVTNNEAEYEALIAGLRIAEQMGVKNLQANVDSRLVANQVPRSENKKVDALSKTASTSFAHLTKQVLVEELKENFINEAEVLAVMEEEGDTWITPIYNYLNEETLPAEKENARAIRRKSGRKKRASSNPRSKEQGKMEKYCNSKVRNTSFKPGDLVYRSNEASHAKESRKLSPKWQGPYEVMKALGNEAYKLRDGNGKLLP